MRSVSGGVRFIDCYSVANLIMLKNWERTPPDKPVRYTNVSYPLVCISSGTRAFKILYLSGLSGVANVQVPITGILVCCIT